MQMKNQRFLYPESAAERRQAEDDPLVRDGVGVDGEVSACLSDTKSRSDTFHIQGILKCTC